jgi:hypothetical protein
MNAFFAAVSYFGDDEESIARIELSLSRLQSLLKESRPGEDPMGLATYQQIVSGIPSRRINVGVATRRLISNALYEFFRTEGSKPLKELWWS